MYYLLEVFMKKLCIVGLLLLILLAAPLFAHGHNGNGHRNGDYALCSIQNCDITSNHYHNSIYYSGHSYNDGHNWHEICPENNCNKIDAHTYSGHHYFSQTR